MKRAVFLLMVCGVAANAQQTEESIHIQFARRVFSESLTTARTITVPSDRDYAISEIAKAQARSGFFSESMNTAELAGKLRRGLPDDLASIEAERGEYQLAMKAVEGKDVITQDEVREKIGMEQARRGDVHAALLSAQAIHNGYYRETVLYFACLELMRQGNHAEAERVGHRLSRKYPDLQPPHASEFTPGDDWRTPAPRRSVPTRQDGSCDAWSRLHDGQIAEAVSCVEAKPNPADVASDLARLAENAADLGNLDAALRIANNSHLSGTRYEEMYLVGALGNIGRLWADVDSSAALEWAETRPSPFQRAVALAGVAEGAATLGQPLR